MSDLKPDFSRIVTQAYREILDREPDPGGLTFYRDQMASGWTETTVREALLRSPEYLSKWHFPGEAPPPPPPPPPVPGGPGMALHVEGTRFVNGDGNVVHLQGSIVCCANDDADGPGAITMGWPLVTRATLDFFAANALNYTDLRLGPMIRQIRVAEGDEGLVGEPNPLSRAYLEVEELPDTWRYDLTRWNDAYWANLRDIVGYGQARGIYFGIDLIDEWGLDHQVTPWSAERNIQGFEGGSLAITQGSPMIVVDLWLRKIVAELGGYPNVIFHDGNESFKGFSKEWTWGVRDIVKDELRRRGFSDRPFGSNSQNAEINAGCDYEVWHEKYAVQPTDRPTMTTEYGDLGAGFVWEQIQKAREMGGAYHYWRGDHPWRTYANMIAKIRGLVTGHPVVLPYPIPADCPILRWFASRIYKVMDANFQIIAGTWVNGMTLPRGTAMVEVDATMRFGEGRGLPCNAEHDNCGGRACEDPRGGVWKVLEAPSAFDGVMHLGSNNYQCRLGDHKTPLPPGHYRLRVSPLPDARDGEEGKALVVASDASTTTDWEIQ